MLIVMKTYISKILLVTCLIYPFTAGAELYKGKDAEGNVVYSDTPFEDAEKYKAPPISVVDTHQVDLKKQAIESGEAEEKKKLADFKYTKFDITSPENNQTIWNDPNLTVTLELSPPLSTELEHTVWLVVDGVAAIKNSPSTTVQLGRLDRGAHKLQAQVRDSNGKIIVRTRTSIVHIKHGSAN